MERVAALLLLATCALAQESALEDAQRLYREGSYLEHGSAKAALARLAAAK